jgi:lipopolysaccharide export system protein LptC
MEGGAMATQKGARRKKPAAKPEAEEVPNETQEALVAFQAKAEQERQARAKIEKELTDARDVLEAAQAEVKQERRTQVETQKALTETKEALAVAEATVEQERQTRIETERALTDTKEALAAARKELERKEQSQGKIGRSEDEKVRTQVQAKKSGEAKTRNAQPPPKEPGELTPHSFTVRINADERGQPHSTHVTHTQTEDEDKFPGLDAQRLVAFMEECIRPPVIRESRIASEALSISDVRVVRTGVPEATALFLDPDEAFLVQVLFKLGGSEAYSLTAEEPPFVVEVHARELNSGTSTELAIYSANLEKDVLEYTVPVQVPGLSRGLYRLRTLVKLQPPIEITRVYAGPVIDLT